MAGDVPTVPQRSNTCYNAPSRHCHHRGAQVHGVHQAASLIPALYLPSCSRYSFTDPERMTGCVSPCPWCTQRATGPRLLRDSPQPAGLEPTTSRSLIERAITTRLSHHRCHGSKAVRACTTTVCTNWMYVSSCYKNADINFNF